MNAPTPIFLRRIGTGGPARCDALEKCPDIWELSDGNFAIIGRDITENANLPASAGCGSNERVVLVPRALLISAKQDIPNP